MRRLAALLAALLITKAMPLLASDIEGQIMVKNARDNRDAVVYIDKIAGKTFPVPSTPVPLDQVNLTFMPHVLPVLAGTTVAFPNSDEIRHNVFSPSPIRFNLGTYAQKTTKYYRFDKPGIATLLCNVHAEMSAYVVVTETPYFAVTSKDGKFTLKDVPAGKYTLKVWHEKAKATSIPIEVTDSVTLVLPPIDLKR